MAPASAYAALTLSGGPSHALPLASAPSSRSPTTPLARFGLLPFRSPLLRESLLISFPGLLRWFTSSGLSPAAYLIRPSGWRAPARRVTPFGNPRITGYVLLPAAYRSLSRPSSSCGSSGIRHEPMFPWPYLSSRRSPGLGKDMPSLSFFPSLLSQRSVFVLWDGIELNYRPPPYQSGALTN